MEHESDGDTSCSRDSRYIHQRIDKGTGGLENQRTSGDYPNSSVDEIGQNTEKSPGDLKRLAITPVEDNPIMLM